MVGFSGGVSMEFLVLVLFFIRRVQSKPSGDIARLMYSWSKIIPNQLVNHRNTSDVNNHKNVLHM